LSKSVDLKTDTNAYINDQTYIYDKPKEAVYPQSMVNLGNIGLSVNINIIQNNKNPNKA